MDRDARPGAAPRSSTSAGIPPSALLEATDYASIEIARGNFGATRALYSANSDNFSRTDVGYAISGATKRRASIVEPKDICPHLRAIDGIASKPDAPRQVFPGARLLERFMRENSVLAALRRLAYTKEAMRGRGFRGMASTLVHEQGWNHQAVLSLRDIAF